ncbi:MAG: exo-alpha-sialidase [Candidatus Didemnitutus sp.]|nr:exo-alpha-sialidase [Candidatus Didemnitutus sp.]
MKILAFLSILLGVPAALVGASAGGPVRPLAQEHVVFDESPDPANVPLYTPSILALPGGRLVGASERSGAWKSLGNPWARLSTSDDGGLTWTLRATAGITHGRIFRSGSSLYYLGHAGDLQIMRSDDNGETWTAQVALTSGQSWHQTAANVWHARGNVYLVMERSTSNEIKGWGIGMLAPVLMRAREGDDLTRRESWTFADELVFADLIPGYRENTLETDYFGVPFYPQTFPVANYLAPGRPMHPMGWLETNVVQVVDPNHLWHDPSGRTFHLLMRAHTGGTGYACLAQVVEHADGTMKTSLVRAPSGKTMLFLPFPGGQMRFHILYDERTKLYWMLGSQATDSMARVETLTPDRFDLPNNQRQRLVLHFSKNLVDWCFAGLVAVVEGNRESRHYASMDIDGEDLVILSRSGDVRAKTAHNGNLITFHRVKGFRSLIY